MEAMKAFVASGGASKGQYLIGALDYLVQTQGSYDIYSGVSIGAMVAGFASQYPKTQDALMLQDLKNLALSIKTENVHKRWPLGYLQVLWKTGARSSKPLRSLLKDYISAEKIASSGKFLRVGATRLSGNSTDPSVIFTENCPRIVEAIIASSALSPILEAEQIEGEWFVDGGFQSPTPVSAAIKAGATEIDIVLCYPKVLSSFEFGIKLTALEILKRELELVIHKLAWLEIKHTLAINKLVLSGEVSDKRFVKVNVIHPKQELEVDSMVFDPKDARMLQELGFNDAKEYFKGSH